METPIFHHATKYNLPKNPLIEETQNPFQDIIIITLL